MSNKNFHVSYINPARVQDLFNIAFMRFNKWQEIYANTQDQHALHIMYQYAGQMQVLSMILGG